MKAKLKRKLLVSLVFDLGIVPSAFLIPTVCLYWNLEDSEKPFKLTLRLGWLHKEVNYEYNRLMRYLQKYTIYDLAKTEITERFAEYKGHFYIDGGYYESELWKAIKAANSKEQAEKWAKKNQYVVYN